MDVFVVPGDTLVQPSGSYDAYFFAETRGLCEHYRYHKHKLVFFLASMRQFASQLRDQGETVVYKTIENTDGETFQSVLSKYVAANGVESLSSYVAKDDHFDAVRAVAEQQGITVDTHPNPNFLLDRDDISDYFSDNDCYHHSFYKWQRQRMDVLMEGGEPVGGSWSYDDENREALRDTSRIPSLPNVASSDVLEDVKAVIDKHFPDHPGNVENFWLPTTRQGAEEWLNSFFQERFEDFGPYQDAINDGEAFAFHSVISPMMNNGLLNPALVVQEATKWYDEHDTHLPSVEGFIRQIIGWREFIRSVYEAEDLTGNYFDHQRGLSDAWWTGDTGLKPIDDVIDQVNRLGYAHHIQRLMLMSNAMLLCEAHPDDVYQWFMEFFVDSADWVMEPNVYGMGQYADGGVFATKPYISSSNYVLKMSDYDEGAWCDAWDALYWSFLDRHRDELSNNHRMGFMYSLLDKKDEEEMEAYHERGAKIRDRLTVPK